MKKLILMSLLLFSGLLRAEVKTLTCQTSDLSPNVDIRLEFGEKTAVVKLIVFGNEEEEIPTDGPSKIVSLKTAKKILGGNALIFIGPYLLYMENGSGTVTSKYKGELDTFDINNCKVL